MLASIKFMLETAPELKLEERIMHLCGVPTHSINSKTRPLTKTHAVILRAIAPRVAPFVFSKKFYNTLYQALSDELTLDPPESVAGDSARLQALLMCFAELVASIPSHEYQMINEEIIDFYDKCLKRGTEGYYIDLVQYYCSHTTHSYEKHAPIYTSNVLEHMNADDKTLVDKVVPCITAIFAKLPKETQFGLVPLIREAIEKLAVDPVDEHLGPNVYRKKVKTIKMLETKEGVKTLAGVVQNSIMYGALNVRIDSAFCFKYLIDFSSPLAIKTEVIKICGALIRVVNDKFPPELKTEIFLTFRQMLTIAATAVRAMVPQLQTTFLKAFGDASSNEAVRQIVVENLLLLIQMTPKADPIVKELTSLLDGDKIDGE